MTNEVAIQDQDELIQSEMAKMVDTYDSYMKKATFGREQLLRRVTVALAGVQAGQAVLEVGCATGSLSLAAKQAAGPSGRVVGIDILPGMIEASRRKAAEAHADVAFQEASIAKLPFPENSFDAALCSFMIFHMSEATRAKGLAEIQRVLKPGGRLLLLDLALPAQPFQRWIARQLLGFSADDDLRKLIPLMEASGFTGMEYGPARFRIMGLSVIAYLRASARKG